MRIKSVVYLCSAMCLCLVMGCAAFAQSVSATLGGTVTDQSGAAIPNANITVKNAATGIERQVVTNEQGRYVVPLLPPSEYTVAVNRDGFAPTEIQQVILNANDQRSLNIQLKVGEVSGSVTVSADPPLINQSPSVGTSVDRNLINNMPLNGRSLQTLINLAPGVVTVPVSDSGDSQGQFSVNGQRANTNYFTVDGVSGNFGTTNTNRFGQNGSGSVPSTSITGGFTNLASVDSLQEFTIQTSTTSAQFGRSPGAQVAFTTRSGTNDFHGSLFEYVRNDVFDARDFFDTKKPPLRFNDFGGTIGGPVILPRFGEGTPFLWKGTDKTFFFFSYEGQRFVQPQSPITNLPVPSLATRRNAANPIAVAILNAFPLPNGADIRDTTGALTGGAFYSTSYSNPSSLDSWSLRVDHKLTKNISLFVRGNFSPSNGNTINRNNPSFYTEYTQNTQMLTAGSTQVISSRLVNEFTTNISRQEGNASSIFNGFGGGTEPDSALFFAPGFNQRNYIINALPNVYQGLDAGPATENQNKQLQFIDNVSYSLGTHQLRFGADYRRLLPTVGQGGLITSITFATLQGLNSQTFSRLLGTNLQSFTAKFETYSFYAQDTWRASKRLTLDYGTRWEIVPSPTGVGDFKAVTLTAPPDLSQRDQSGLTLAPLGTPYYKTEYTHFAPRFGISYLVSDKAGRELVLKGGIGVYYDLGQSGFGQAGFPYRQSRTILNSTLPISAAALNFPAINFTPSLTNRAAVTAAAVDYTLPRTYQWNVTAQQSLGANQVISVAYVAALGRKLVRSRGITLATSATQVPGGAYFSPGFSSVTYIDNSAESSYHSMQVQFNRRLSRGLQALVSYTWSHSIDNGSDDNSITSPGFIFSSDAYRGDSDFDVRHNLSGALSYELPVPKFNKLADAVLRGWSLDSVFSARTGLPYSVTISELSPFGAFTSFRRPDLTGAPLYLNDPAVPTGRRLNPAAFNFVVPAGIMGNLGRNSLRGEKLWQVDLALRRNIALSEKVSLNLRVDAFNVFNHPNFLYPTNRTGNNIRGVVSIPQNFGIITRSAARGYGGGSNTGGFNPLFQNGGPRSLQFSARISF